MKERVHDKVTKLKVAKRMAITVVTALAKVSQPNEAGQVDCVAQGRERRTKCHQCCWRN